MLVSVLSEELLMVRLPVSNLHLAAVDLLKLLYFESDRQFLVFTRADNEVSLILERDAVGPFASIANASVSPMTWHALRLGNDDEVTDCLVTRLLTLLATQNYSIFYQSTATNDYILVNSSQLDDIVCCLRKYFTVDVKIKTPSNEEEFVRTTPRSSVDDFIQAQPEIEPLDDVAEATPAALPVELALLPEIFCLHSLSLTDHERIIKPLIRSLFLMNEDSCFFSFAIVEDQVSMIVDIESADLFKPYTHIDQQYKWRAFKVLGEWGFSEIGLVNSLSSYLTKSGIESPLFLSTFSRDFIFVDFDVTETARKAFSEAGFVVN